MSAKAATVLLIMVTGATLLMCLCYAAIFVQPDILLNPYPPRDATLRAEVALSTLQPSFNISTATPTSIFGPTWTPTVTFTPSPTGTPTQTRTPTPTSSPTPTATDFPTRTATATNPPPPPPPPTATSTPAPALYTVARRTTEPNCDVIRIKGQVFDADGLPRPGVTMQVGEVNVPNSRFNTSPTDANGRYVFDFAAPNDDPHTWFVVPLENGAPAVEEVQFTTDPGDVCEYSTSVQIVTIDWRRRAAS
jgi:hypothetical protein